MSEHTFITGKDAALEVTIAQTLDQLAELGFDIEEARWLNPVPHCWSVHIRDRNCPILFTNGKGASRKAALASALGEFVERLASQYFFGDFHWHREGDEHGMHDPAERWFTIDAPGVRPEGLLTDDLWGFYGAADYDVTTRDWIDLNSGRRDAVCALPYTRIATGETVYFPASVVGNLYVSNGLSAGNNAAEARTQGLSEVFERHVKNRVIAEGIALPRIPEHVVEQYPDIARAISSLNEHGFGLRLLDASLGGRYPVICVTLIDPQSGGVFASFGAHPCFEVALERTVTELLQGRELADLHHFHPPTFDADLVADPQNLELHFIDSSGWLHWDFFRDEPDHEFVHWDFTEPDNEQRFRRLCALVEETGHEVYVADYAHVGLYACRVLVPGMSEVYPVDELYERHNNVGLDLIPYTAKIDHLTATDAANLVALIDTLDIDELTPVSDIIGLAADPADDSALYQWQGLRLGELRLLALLAAETAQIEKADEERAEALQWAVGVPPISADRAAIYRAATLLMELDERQPMFQTTLNALFSEETLIKAENLIRGKAGFFDLPALGTGHRHSQRHRDLMAAFERAYAAKLR